MNAEAPQDTTPVKPVLLGVLDVRRIGPLGRGVVGGGPDVGVVAVEEARAEVEVPAELPVERLVEPEVVVLLVDRRPPRCSCPGRRSPGRSSAGGCLPRSAAVVECVSVDLRVDQHLLLRRGGDAGDDDEMLVVFGKPRKTARFPAAPSPSPLVGSVGEHRRGSHHPLLVVLGPRWRQEPACDATRGRRRRCPWSS